MNSLNLLICGKFPFSDFESLKIISRAYFLNIWSDKKGNIQYFEPEEIVYDKKDMWDEAGKDKRKVKQLVIK